MSIRTNFALGLKLRVGPRPADTIVVMRAKPSITARRSGLAPLLLAVALVSCSSPLADDVQTPMAFAPAPVEAALVKVSSPVIAPRSGLASIAGPRPTYEGFASGEQASTNLAAMTFGETDVYSAPGDAAPILTLAETTILGTPIVLGVIDSDVDGWVNILVPGRPNGRTGWVREDSIHLYVVEGRIVVDLTAKTLTYSVNGETVLETPVAIGTSRNPTPSGDFFVTDSVTLSNPNSPWGPHALGLSARSETITEYNGGDGIIGIHGTNKPGSIGTAASLGCVRLPNDMITLLHSMVPIGTPVEIRP